MLLELIPASLRGERLPPFLTLGSGGGEGEQGGTSLEASFSPKTPAMATGSTPTTPQLDGDASTLNLGGLKGGLGRSGPGGLLPAIPHERTRPTSLPAQDSLSGTLGSRAVSVHGSHIQAPSG